MLNLSLIFIAKFITLVSAVTIPNRNVGPMIMKIVDCLMMEQTFKSETNKKWHKQCLLNIFKY